MCIKSTLPDSENDLLKYVEVCPLGHVGRGILLEAEPIEAANGDMLERVKWECELCGQVWFENVE